jgi:hypothetical protein
LKDQTSSFDGRKLKAGLSVTNKIKDYFIFKKVGVKMKEKMFTFISDQKLLENGVDIALGQEKLTVRV